MTCLLPISFKFYYFLFCLNHVVAIVVAKRLRCMQQMPHAGVSEKTPVCRAAIQGLLSACLPANQNNIPPPCRPLHTCVNIHVALWTLLHETSLSMLNYQAHVTRVANTLSPTPTPTILLLPHGRLVSQKIS